MFFLHCDRCDRTLRAGSFDGNDLDPESITDLGSFQADHAGCTLRSYQPTGRATASGPWHEPMSERWVEVREGPNLGVAIGSRSSLDEPLVWRIEPGTLDEEVEITLDRELFWDSVERALQPLPVPQRRISSWATLLDNHLRNVSSSDWILLYDDTQQPDQSFGCLTLTARSPLETSLRSFGFAPEVGARLAELFSDREFPPIRIARKVTLRPQSGRCVALGPLALTHPAPSSNPA